MTTPNEAFAPFTCKHCDVPREEPDTTCPACGGFGVIAAAVGKAKGSALRALQQLTTVVNE